MLDAIVLGVGVMGAAVARALAARGRSVLALEAHALGHALGSSHGHSRVIRKAYFEEPRYVPLIERAYTLWHELERENGEALLLTTGGLHLGRPDGAGMRGVRESADTHALSHEVLAAAEVRRRFPQFRMEDDEIGVFEPDAGVLAPERAVAAMVASARAHGAEVRDAEPVLDVALGPDGVRVTTVRGAVDARELVVCAGPWLAGVGKSAALFAPGAPLHVGVPLVVQRQVQLWFAPRTPERFEPGAFPLFIHFRGDRAFYGMPRFGRDGVKVCRHHGGAHVSPDGVDRRVSADDEATVRDYVRAAIPDADGALLAGEVCMYTCTPDENFVIGRHPAHARVLVAGGFSGHGFKLAPLVGEVIADLHRGGTTRHDIGLFDPTRFAAR